VTFQRTLLTFRIGSKWGASKKLLLDPNKSRRLINLLPFPEIDTCPEFRLFLR
jgi:hypothetical protein